MPVTDAQLVKLYLTQASENPSGSVGRASAGARLRALQARNGEKSFRSILGEWQKAQRAKGLYDLSAELGNPAEDGEEQDDEREHE